MSSYNIDFVRFDCAAQLRCGFSFNYPRAQQGRHLCYIVLVQIEFLSNLEVGEVKPHQIQTQYPLAKRLMMTGKDGVSQVIEVPVTRTTMIPLAVALSFIAASFCNSRRITPDAMEAIRPANLADGFKAFGIVNEVIDLEHKGSMLAEISFIKELVRGFHDLPDSPIE